MLSCMSAYSSPIGTAMMDEWPMARVMAGMSAVPVSHAIDLAMVFPVQERSRHDAIIIEARRHLGGCMHAIEMALRVALDDAPLLARALALMPGPVCWPTIRAQPTLVGPGVLAHMQLRAGVSLMLRQFGQPDVERPEDGDPSPLLPSDDPAVSEAIAALSLAEGRWIAAGSEDLPMQPDLPAEYFTELVWTGAACLFSAVQRSGLEVGDQALAALERSAWALLADYDEGTSPIAEADLLVRRLGERADMPELLGAALGQRRFLIFAALVARRLRMSVPQVVDILVMRSLHQVAILCRALGGSYDDYSHLLLTLRPVRPSLSDAAIVIEAERYRGLVDEQADAALTALRIPPAFRAKLDHMGEISAWVQNT